MKEAPQTPREWLLYALDAYNIAVLAEKDNFVEIEKGYVVEIESNGVFKLLCGGAVVAPFRDLEELCRFIEMSP